MTPNTSCLLLKSQASAQSGRYFNKINPLSLPDHYQTAENKKVSGSMLKEAKGRAQSLVDIKQKDIQMPVNLIRFGST